MYHVRWITARKYFLRVLEHHVLPLDCRGPEDPCAAACLRLCDPRLLTAVSGKRAQTWDAVGAPSIRVERRTNKQDTSTST